MSNRTVTACWFAGWMSPRKRRSPDLRRQLGALNRKRAEERYSFEALCAAYRELYASMLTLP